MDGRLHIAVAASPPGPSGHGDLRIYAYSRLRGSFEPIQTLLTEAGAIHVEHASIADAYGTRHEYLVVLNQFKEGLGVCA